MMPADKPKLDKTAPGEASQRVTAVNHPKLGQRGAGKRTTAPDAAEPGTASGHRFGRFPAWALMPRAVAIYLSCMVILGVLVWLVLGWQ